MASSSSVLALAVLAAVFAGVSCKLPNLPPGPDIPPVYGNNWLKAKATWYGRPTGAGGDDNGGGCGYKDVDKPPFSAKTSCGNPPIFKDGKGCGSCYEIKCSQPAACSGQAVMIRIADQNEEPIAPYHFDLTGTAFGALAKPGLEQQLRSAGELELDFRRVRCTYPPGTKVTFHVETGSNPNYLALLVKYIPVDGNAVNVEIKQKGESEWIPLKPSWGAIWRIDTPKILTGPFSVRYTTEGGTKTVAEDIIPAGWTGGATYTSNIDSNSGAGGVSDSSPAAAATVPTPAVPDAGPQPVPDAGPGASLPDAGPGAVPDAGAGGAVPDAGAGAVPAAGESAPATVGEGGDGGEDNVASYMASFTPEKGSTTTNLAVTAKFFGDDDFAKVMVKGQNCKDYIEMTNTGGSTWKSTSAYPLKLPLAISFETKKGVKMVDDHAITSL